MCGFGAEYGKLVVGDYERVPQYALVCGKLEVENKVQTAREAGREQESVVPHSNATETRGKESAAGLFDGLKSKFRDLKTTQPPELVALTAASNAELGSAA